MAELELFFDCGSLWTYLAFHGLSPIVAETGVRLSLQPILVGGIINAIHKSLHASRADPVPQSSAYHGKHLQHWARFRGLEIGWPELFPVNSVQAIGSPSLFGDGDDLYFGQDHLALVRLALQGKRR